MPKGKKVLLLLGVVVLVAIAIIGGFTYAARNQPTAGVPGPVTATSTGMRFEIADTQAKQELGLGNRASVPDNYGMLFVFTKPDRYGFWMKDMLTPIDITWLSDTGDIILIDHSVQPDTYPHAFYPPTPVRYVLETRAGYAVDHNWTPGTHIALPSPYGS